MGNRRYGWHSGKLKAKRMDPKGLFLEKLQIAADGDIPADVSYVEMDGSVAQLDLDLAAPAQGRLLVLHCVEASNDCVVTLGAGTWDGTNSIATFDAASETLVLLGISATRFVILENIGAVVFS